MQPGPGTWPRRVGSSASPGPATTSGRTWPTATASMPWCRRAAGCPRCPRPPPPTWSSPSSPWRWSSPPSAVANTRTGSETRGSPSPSRPSRSTWSPTVWENGPSAWPGPPPSPGLLTDAARDEHLFGFCLATGGPGELVCLDSFYIGKLKGVGKVYQLTAIDVFTRWAIVMIVLGPVTHDHTMRFVDHILRLYRRHGVKVRADLDPVTTVEPEDVVDEAHGVVMGDRSQHDHDDGPAGEDVDGSELVHLAHPLQ